MSLTEKEKEKRSDRIWWIITGLLFFILLGVIFYKLGFIGRLVFFGAIITFVEYVILPVVLIVVLVYMFGKKS